MRATDRSTERREQPAGLLHLASWRDPDRLAEWHVSRTGLRAPTAKTVSEAAEQLIKGAHDGSILDRSGKPYTHTPQNAKTPLSTRGF